MDHEDDPKGDDQPEAIGYGQPPKKHRFKPGVSGNPRGRPAKQQKSFERAVLDELAGTITIKEGGVARRVTKHAALAKTAVAQALQGNYRLFMAVATIATRSDQEKVRQASQTTRFTLVLNEGQSPFAKAADEYKNENEP